MNEKKSTFMI